MRRVVPKSLAARGAVVASTGALAVLLALARRNPHLLLKLLRRTARRPLTSASVPAAVAVLVAFQRLYAHGVASVADGVAPRFHVPPPTAHRQREMLLLGDREGHGSAVAGLAGEEEAKASSPQSVLVRERRITHHSDRPLAAEQAAALAAGHAVMPHAAGFSSLSRLGFMPRLLTSPLRSVKAFAYAQAAAASRGWGHVQAFWSNRTSAISSHVQAGIEGTLTRSTDALAARLLTAMKDPDMPLFLQEMLDAAFVEIMPSVRQKVLRKADELLFTPVKLRLWRRQPHNEEADQEVIEATLALMPWHRRMRARLLYAMDPNDQTIWRCMKRKRWWGIQLVGVIPIIGPLWWLLVFVMKDKTDEFQLVDLIVSNEASKFVSWGFVSMALGTARYYACASAQWTDCTAYGPRLNYFDFAFFVMQVTLVWTAFWMLPYSRRRARHRSHVAPGTNEFAPHGILELRQQATDATGPAGHATTGGAGAPAGGGTPTPAATTAPVHQAAQAEVGGSAPPGSPTAEAGAAEGPADAATAPQDDDEAGSGQDAAEAATGAQAEGVVRGAGVTQRARDMLQRTTAQARQAFQVYFNPRQGGLVRRMFWYLTAIILMVVCMGLVAWLLCPTNWQLLATLYWIRVVFGLLSAPFVVFKIPLVSKILVPARKTSYNQLGETVVYRPKLRPGTVTPTPHIGPVAPTSPPPTMPSATPATAPPAVSSPAPPTVSSPPTPADAAPTTPPPRVATALPQSAPPRPAVHPNHASPGGLRRERWSQGWIRRERRTRGGLLRERRPHGSSTTSIPSPASR